MDERHLLLLGILKTQDSHGYHITEFIEHRLKRIINLKKTTAYSILDRLVDQGYLTMMNEQEGNRPTRKVYSLSQSGDELFFKLLDDNLDQVGQMSLPQEIGIMLIDFLPEEEVLRKLENKLEKLKELIKTYEEAPSHQFGLGVTFAISHRIAIMRAEQVWLEEMIGKLWTRVRG